MMDDLDTRDGAGDAESHQEMRRHRLARMSALPWSKFLLRTAIQIAIILLLASLIFWLLGR